MTELDQPAGAAGRGPVMDEADPERLEALQEIDEETLPHALPRNKWGKFVLRMVFSIGFLALLLWKLPSVSVSDLVPTLSAATFGWVALAIGVHIVAYVLQALRWAEVSDTLGRHVRLRRLFSHLLAGEFVSNALPTSFGGDVVRVVRLGKDTGDYADAFASTSLERLTGWLVLPVLSGIGFILEPDYLHLGSATTVAIVINIVTLVGLFSLLWAAGHERLMGRLVGRDGWRRYLGAVHLGIVAFRGHRGQVMRVLLAGLGFQFLQCVSVWSAARALQIEPVGIVACLAFFPPTAVAQNLPLSLGGLGIREAAFVLFFGALGATDAQCVALGLLVYIVFIGASLAGAPSFAFGAGRRRQVAPVAAQT